MKSTVKPTTALNVALGAIIFVILLFCFEAWLLGLILSWFNVSLTFLQNLIIIFLVNLIVKSK